MGQSYDRLNASESIIRELALKQLYDWRNASEAILNHMSGFTGN